MALARYPATAVIAEPSKLTKWRRLALSAAMLAAVCGVVAFLLLVLRDQKQRHLMVNEQHAPASTGNRTSVPPSPLSQASAARGATQPDRALPAASDGKTAASATHSPTDFNLTKSSRVSSLGPVRLKLMRTDPMRRLYDMNVIVGRRSFAHKRLKANQPVWIAVNSGKQAVQMVVSSIRSDSVSGYWSLSDRPAQVNPRHLRRK